MNHFGRVWWPNRKRPHQVGYGAVCACGWQTDGYATYAEARDQHGEHLKGVRKNDDAVLPDGSVGGLPVQRACSGGDDVYPLRAGTLTRRYVNDRDRPCWHLNADDVPSCDESDTCPCAAIESA